MNLSIGWTDEAATKWYASVPLAGVGVASNSMGLGNTANFASGQISLWSAGANSITYQTGYTACTSGSGSYSLRIAVKQMQ